MIPTNDLRNFAKYGVITSVRQSDGAKLIATRVVIDEKLPVRWDVEVSYPHPTTFFTGLVRERIDPPSTSQLIKKAQEEGFGDWYPVPEKMEEIFPHDALGDKSKMQLAPKYPEPDNKDYLVD